MNFIQIFIIVVVWVVIARSWMDSGSDHDFEQELEMLDLQNQALEAELEKEQLKNKSLDE